MQKQFKATVRIGLCSFIHLNIQKNMGFSTFFFFQWKRSVIDHSCVLAGLSYVTRECWASCSCCTSGTIFLRDPRGPRWKQRYLRTLRNRLFPTRNQLHVSGPMLKIRGKTGLNTRTNCMGPSPQGREPKCDLQTDISLLLKGIYLQFLSTRN